MQKLRIRRKQLKTNNKFLESILHNWVAKLVCIIGAVILFVGYRVTLLEKKSFVIPLEVQANGNVMPVSKIKSTITVTVRAYGEIITTVHSSDIKASVDLSHLAKSGEYTVPINLEVNQDFLSYDPFEIRANPEYIKVKVEKNDLKYIQIEPTLIGEPAHGYEVIETIVDPTHAEVVGPQSLLEQVDLIYTEPIDITDLKSKISSEVSYKEFNKMINVVDKGPYKVSIVVAPKEAEKTFENLPLFIKNLNTELKAAENSFAYTLVLTGTVNGLEQFELKPDFIYVDCSAIEEEGTYELPVSYMLPSNIKIKEIPVETVQIQFVKNDNDTNENQE